MTLGTIPLDIFLILFRNFTHVGGAVEAVYFSLKVTLLVNLSLSIFLIFFRKLTHVGELWRRCKEASAVEVDPLDGRLQMNGVRRPGLWGRCT